MKGRNHSDHPWPGNHGKQTKATGPQKFPVLRFGLMDFLGLLRWFYFVNPIETDGINKQT